MKKMAAVIMGLMMAFPAVAQPVCAMACGDVPAAERVSCCCATAAPADGIPVLSGPSCCPADAPLADVTTPDSAVSTGEALRHGGGEAPASAAVLVAAAELAPPSENLNPGFTGRALSTGPPIFLSVSSLRC